MKREHLSEAIAWNAYRAVTDAHTRLPDIPDADDVYVEVAIKLRWATGSRTAGKASCIYSTPQGPELAQDARKGAK